MPITAFLVTFTWFSNRPNENTIPTTEVSCEYVLDLNYVWFETGHLFDGYYGYMLVVIPNPYDWDDNLYFTGSCFSSNDDYALISKDTCEIKKLLYEVENSSFGVVKNSTKAKIYTISNNYWTGYNDKMEYDTMYKPGDTISTVEVSFVCDSNLKIY
jgi:hypothetical protein